MMRFKPLKWRVELTKDELYIRDIITKHLEDPEVKKTVTPISGVCYLYDKKIGTRIKVDGARIDISNQDFLYKKEISGNLSVKLVKAIKAKVEEELLEVNKELFINEIDLLRKILKSKSE